MRTIVRTMFGVGLVALLAGPALAQGGRGFGMMGGGYGFLVGNTSVIAELKLDDQQKEKAGAYAEKAREQGREMREKLQGLEGDELRTKRQELMKEMNESALKAVGEFLKPEQIARLKQIRYQTMGATAFSDPDVAKKLNLTDSQKSDVQSIVQESQTQMREVFQQFQDDREGATKKMAELRKEFLEKATSKLNDEQQKTWKELIGAHFELKMDPPRNQ